MVEALGYIGIRSRNLEDWAAYATRFLGMQLVDKTSSMLSLRMDDRKQRVIVNADTDGGPAFFGWEASGAAALDSLAARLEAAGVAVARGSRALADERRVKDLIVFTDPIGNLFVRRVQLEAERRLLERASKVDLGHFDNSDWHDRLARAKRDVSWRPGDLTWSVLGMSGNIVTIVLMASLLASLHYVLVLLAVLAAVLSLVLERRVTSKLYEFFYKETPEEREREYLGDYPEQDRPPGERALAVVRVDHSQPRDRR